MIMCDQDSINMECMDCKNELNLCKLCVKWVKACNLHAKCLKADEACIEHLKAEDAQMESLVVNDLCASGSVKAKDLQADSFSANSLCAQSGTINELCVTNLSVQNQNTFNKYRAAVTSSADFLYSLGSPINWDLVLDDPNSNVAMGPFSYTVPLSGYYTATFHLNSNALAGANPILGVPVGHQELLVNGLPLRDQFSPFLSFSDQQNGNFSSLLLLNAGDVITMKYNVIVLDPVLGQIDYAGSVNLQADGTALDTSLFIIHLLSNEMGQPPVSCKVCPLVEIPCSHLEIDCNSQCDSSAPHCR